MKRSVYIGFIWIFLLLNLSFGQDCDSGYVWLEIPPSWDYEMLWGIDSTNCFYENHINIIQNLIDNNLESLDSIMDSNDDGVIEPLEFGGFSEGLMGDFHNPGTQWSDGKLVSLFCNGSCGLSYLPENICDIINDTSIGGWTGWWNSGFFFNNNNICPPIPTCIESYDPYDPDLVNIDFGFQDCLDCDTYGEIFEYIDFELIGNYEEDGITPYLFNHTSNSNCYSQSDIDVIDSLIEINPLLQLMDYHWDPPGEMSDLLNDIYPLQLGLQEWTNGRLTLLQLGESGGDPSEYSFNVTSLPENFNNLNELGELNLENNFLEYFPIEVYDLINLNRLNFRDNQITGEIPLELGTLINLEWLDLGFNEFSGEIPVEIVNLINLVLLSLSGNQLSGEIPSGICDLNIIYNSYNILNYNNFCPPYPDCGEGPITSEEYQDTSNCEDLSNSDVYPFEYSLNKPYPNPFNPSTMISFSVPSFDKVSINVYDLKGSLVTTLVDEYYHSGNHSINWDGSNYSSGNYIVKMKSSNFESSQIITLVK